MPHGFYLLYKKNEKNKSKLPSDFKRIVQANVQYKNIYSGKRCFILATGPSILFQDLKPLKNEVCFAVSEFYLHHDINIIRPDFHVLAPNHPPFTMEAVSTRLTRIQELYQNEVTVFLGDNNYVNSYWEFLRKKPLNMNLNIHYINYFNSYQLNDDNCNKKETWDIHGNPFSPRTVVYTAIQIAVYMGFKQIYLLGCDHDYLSDITRVTNHHFYQEGEGISDVEHLSEFTTEKWLEEYYLRWKQYRLMKQYLELKEIQIFNATRGGLLDVFPRIDYEKFVGL